MRVSAAACEIRAKVPTRLTTAAPTTIWAPRTIAFLLRDRQPVRISGQLTDDLTPARLHRLHLASCLGLKKVTFLSCCGYPLQRHEAADVVHEVLQSDLRSRSNDADRPHEPAAGGGLLRSNHILHGHRNLVL